MAPFSHVTACKARWAEYEARYGAGFTGRHAKLFEAEMRSAYGCDATRNGNERAAELLKAAFAGIDAQVLAFGVRKQLARRAA